MAFGVTASDVRLVVGIGSSDVSDVNMNSIINNAEHETERLLNTEFTPKRVTERYITPHSPTFVMLRKTPVTKVVNVKAGGSGGTIIDVSKTRLQPDTGQLQLSKDAAKTSFSDDGIEGNMIDYYYGKLENSSTETTTSATVGTGAATVVTVGSSTSLSAGDHVKFTGIDDEEEITEIDSTGTGTFTASISWPHTSGARVIKMQVHDMAKEMCRVIAGIMTALHMIGETYTFATSYSIPEHAVTKGVPYPHFEKVLNTLTKKRDYIMQRFRPQTSVY